MAPVGGAVGGANGTRGSPVSFALNSSSTGAPPTASTAVSGIGLSTAAVTTAASATNGHGHAFVGNAAAAAVASVSPIAASRGQLLRFEQLTEPEREELRQEARLPIYLPRNLQDDESCIQDPDELRSSPVLSEDSPASLPQTFRSRERMRTSSVALVMCLNLGVDPPDVVKVSPCARMECWIDPATHLSSQVSSRSLLDKIGAALQKQYERWHARARYKLALDPTIEDVKKLCAGLRKFAKDERVLFHYNGHGVPKPTCNGEIWVFNKLYTQYIPLSLYDLQQWIGSPSIFVYDCSGSGILLSKFNSWKDQQQLQQKQNLCKEDCCILPRPHSIYLHQISASVESHSAFSVSKANSATVNGHDVTQSSSPLSTHPSLPNFENCIQLAACREDEVLPMQPTLPADIFTACLTTPIAMALRCYVLNNPFQLVPGLSLDAVEKIPGSLIDRRTMLGELNWIFTAITDTIAWNVLPKALFQRLFRQDLLVASLFRNFLLSQRIMRLYDCNPQSNPALPKTFDHPMWKAWDLALDACLRQLPSVLKKPGAPFCHSAFFAEQLTAFDLWLRFGSLPGAYRPAPPEQLPIVLQVLLSQVHRTRALELLGRFLDLGPWAVSQALSVGIFPYILKLLQSSARELRPLLVFIWTKILAVDGSYQVDLVREGAQRYFLCALTDNSLPSGYRTMAAFVLSCLCAGGYHAGQRACVQSHVVAVCTELLSSAENDDGLHDDVGSEGSEEESDGEACNGSHSKAADKVGICLESNSARANPIVRNQPLSESLKKWLCLLLGRLWDGYCDAKWLAVRSASPERLEPLLYDESAEVRAAAVFALGTLLNSQPQRTDHADATDIRIAVMLLSPAGGGAGLQWDASPIVRQELVAALQWLLFVFDSQYVSAAQQTLVDEARIMTANAAVFASAGGPASHLSASLADFFSPMSLNSASTLGLSVGNGSGTSGPNLVTFSNGSPSGSTRHNRVKSATQFFVTSIVEGVRPSPTTVPVVGTTHQGVIATERKLRRISSGNSLTQQHQLQPSSTLLPPSTQHAATWKLLCSIAALDPHRTVSEMALALVRMYCSKAEAALALQRRPSRDHLRCVASPGRGFSSASTTISKNTTSVTHVSSGSSAVVCRSEPSSPSGKGPIVYRKNLEETLPQLREEHPSLGGSADRSRTVISRNSDSSTLNNGHCQAEQAQAGPQQQQRQQGNASPLVGPHSANTTSGNGLSSEPSYQLISQACVRTSFLERLTRHFQKPCLGEMSVSMESSGTGCCVSSSLRSTSASWRRQDSMLSQATIATCSQENHKTCFRTRNEFFFDYFSVDGITNKSVNGADRDRDSTASRTAEYRLMRNASVRRQALQVLACEAQWRGAMSRAEQHTFPRTRVTPSALTGVSSLTSTITAGGTISESVVPTATTGAPVSLLFHPFEPLLFVAEAHQVSLYNTEQMVELDVLDNRTTATGANGISCHQQHVVSSASCSAATLGTSASLGCSQSARSSLTGSALRSTVCRSAAARISSMTLVNAHHDRCLLFTACSDGAIRAWANTYSTYYNPHKPNPVELVTAFNCMLDASEVQTSLRYSGILLDWDQWNSQLVTCGDMRIVRLWDMAAERKLLDIPLDGDLPLRCVSVDRAAGSSLIALGGIDGSVKVLDRRRSPGGAGSGGSSSSGGSSGSISRNVAVLNGREHRGQVVGVHLDSSASSRHLQLVSASVAGDIRYWMLPMNAAASFANISTTSGTSSAAASASYSPLPKLSGGEGLLRGQLFCQDLTCMAAHPFFPGVLACGTQSQNIVIQEESLPSHVLKLHQDWFSGQRVSPVSAVAFHPYKMCLAAATQDNAISLYHRRKS